jgi:hypothetical protein
MGQKLSPSALPRTNIANTHAHFLKRRPYRADYCDRRLLKIQLGLNRLYARLGAGFVGISSRRA